MVGPSPPFSAPSPIARQADCEAGLNAKKRLRDDLRARRRDHVATLPQGLRALILNRPPAALAEMLQGARTLGLYMAHGTEAPTLGWIRWFHENGWAIALPRFAGKDAPMEFRLWENPWDEAGLETGLMGIPQPRGDAPPADPDALIVPLVGFTPACERLGQGGGHYDRWLAAHPGTAAIGLAWDCQMVDSLPTEPHDVPLRAVVTPTRIHWGND